jgi:acyl transferase domain-containing protein
LPPTLHLTEPNRHLAVEESAFWLNDRLRRWPRPANGRPRRAGVSAFGFGGTNVHLLLREPPELDVAASSVTPQLVTLSAKSLDALKALATLHEEHLGRNPAQSLADVAFTLNAGRAHWPVRWARVVSSIDELRAQLRHLAHSPQTQSVTQRNPRIAFVFSGTTDYFVGLGKDLFSDPHLFRSVTEQLDDEIQRRNPLTHEAGTLKLFWMQYLLGQLLLAYGIRPVAVVGHGTGEYAAACTAGWLDPVGALNLLIQRDKLINALQIVPATLRVHADQRRLAEFVSSIAALSIVAINGADECLVSGTDEAVIALQQRLADENIPFHRVLTPSIDHSSLIEEASKQLDVRAIRSNASGGVQWISTITGNEVKNDSYCSHYWREQWHKPVRFDEAMRDLHRVAPEIVIQIGPGDRLMANALPILGDATWLGILDGNRDRRADLLEVLSALYQRGCNIAWQNLYAQRRQRVDLPAYPFQRQRFWVSTPPAPSERLSGGEAAQRFPHPLLDECFEWTRNGNGAIDGIVMARTESKSEW